MPLFYIQERLGSNPREGTMIYEYKGHKAEITTKITRMSCFGPHEGRVELKSDVLQCKSPDIELDGSERILVNIYRKYFEQNVDKLAPVV